MNDEIISQAKKLCEKFINKVESGRSRSTYTYADCVDLLRLIEEHDQAGSQNILCQEALSLIKKFGGIDGGHHKQWILDQLVRRLSSDYKQWVEDYESGEDGPSTHKWDTGIAP